MREKLKNTIKLISTILSELAHTFMDGFRRSRWHDSPKRKELRVGFDGYPFLEPLAGVGWYSYYLLKEFSSRPDLTVNLYTHALLREKDAALLGESIRNIAGIRLRHRLIPRDIIPSEDFWFYVGAVAITPLLVGLDRNDVFFAPNFIAPKLFRVFGKKVITVHDCTFAFYPELLQKETLENLKKNLPSEIASASKVIAVSQHTKKDIMELFSVSSEKIMVVHNGNPVPHYEPQEISHKPYLLFVGTLEPRKNVASVLEAFKIVRDSGIRLHLYLIGKIGWKSEKILSKIRQHPYSSEITHLAYLAPEKLAAFYRNAFCLVFPSFYEGFGLPVLEAMSQQCPVITSPLTSIPEVGGDACLYVEPNPDDIAYGIIKLFKDPDLRGRMIEKGKIQAQKFSWKTTAERTLEVLKEAAASSPGK